MTKRCYARLHVWGFGFALGIVWAIAMLLTGLVAMTTGWGEGFVETARTMYIGYQASVVGSFIGAAWGFVDMFICGVILAAIYNLFLRCCGKDAAGCEPNNKGHRKKIT